MLNIRLWVYYTKHFKGCQLFSLYNLFSTQNDKKDRSARSFVLVTFYPDSTG